MQKKKKKSFYQKCHIKHKRNYKPSTSLFRRAHSWLTKKENREGRGEEKPTLQKASLLLQQK